MSVRMSVCVFSIEFQTAGWIWMKFGTEVVLEGGKVLGGGGSTWYPPPPGTGCVKGYGGLWSLNHAFWQNHYKVKVAGHPNLVGAGNLFGPQIRIWKELGLMCFWSRGLSLPMKVKESCSVCSK